jgi:threonine/homoserine/homoserine lactone efflux protein
MLTTEWIISFLAFAFSMAISPGPNNLMVMAASSNFGLARTLPHMLGIWIGFFGLLVLTSLGVGSIVKNVPQVYTAMKVLGALYLLYLGVRIAMADNAIESKEARPFTVVEAAGFQLVNPKGWLMALGTASTFAPQGSDPLNYALVAGGFFTLVNIISNGLWALLGRGIAQLLGTPLRRRIFNLSMATLLFISIYFIIV